MEVSTYFPAADSEEESQNIGLLLLLKLFDILEGTHLDCAVKNAKVSNNIKEVMSSRELQTRLGIEACNNGWSCVVVSLCVV